jgi:tRNA dimethylallyltransferase
VTDIAVFDDAHILTGPTASGKSALGLVLAERLGAEILCMDSMTVYRGMEIGTAKPGAGERRKVPHHLLDLCEPWEGASVAWWLDHAAQAARDVTERGKSVLVVGGTPLYLKAMLCGMFAGPEVDLQLRQKLEAQPNAVLQAQLRQVDPKAADRIHLNDHKRLVRALEVYHLTGKPISELQQQSEQPRPRRRPALWLDWPRDVLYRRIEARVDQMLVDGWVEEVRKLRELPKPLSKEAGQAAGYRELSEYIAGQCSYQGAVERTRTRSRQLAKRQLTWFRNFPGLVPVPVSGQESSEDLANECLILWATSANEFLSTRRLD